MKLHGATAFRNTPDHDSGSWETVGRYRRSVPPPAKFGLRIWARQSQFSLTVAKNSGIRVLLDSQVASVLGSELPKLALGLRSFTTTEASPGGTRRSLLPPFESLQSAPDYRFRTGDFEGRRVGLGRSITSPQANRLTAAGKPNAITARGPKILEVVHEEHQRKVPRAGADRSFISVADKRISFLRIGEIRLVGVAKPAGRRRASGTWQTAGVLGSSALQRWHFGVSGPTSGGLAVGHVLRDRHLPCRDRHLPYRDGQALPHRISMVFGDRPKCKKQM